MGPQDGVDLVLEMADHVVHQLGRRDIGFTLIGSGDCFDDLVALSHRLDLTDFVTFTGRIPDAEVSAILSTADVGISPDPKNPLNDVSTMNKTMEYMAFALPVVAFDLRETRVSAGDAAVYATPNDVGELAQLLVDLIDDEPRRRAMGMAGRARIEQELAWDHQAPRYVEVYESLTEGSRRHVSQPRPEADLCAALPAPTSKLTATWPPRRWAGASITEVRTKRVRSRTPTSGSTSTSPTAAFRSSTFSMVNNPWSSDHSCSATTASCTTIGRSEPNWPRAAPVSPPPPTPKSSSRRGGAGDLNACRRFRGMFAFAMLDQIDRFPLPRSRPVRDQASALHSSQGRCRVRFRAQGTGERVRLRAAHASTGACGVHALLLGT